MRQKVLSIILFTLSFIIISKGISTAITVTANPNPASVNQNVNVNITTTFGGIRISPCVIEGNFGDGSPWIDVGSCTDSPCNLSTSHIYNSVGTYTITVRSKTGFCRTPPTQPDPAITSVRINCQPLNITTPSTLPSAAVGQVPSYSKHLQTSGGAAPITFGHVSGSLPPGLSLDPSSGLISGSPTQKGSYTFTVRATDNCPLGAQSVQKTFSILVKPPLTARMKIAKPDLIIEITGGDFKSKPLGDVHFEGKVKNIGNANAGPFKVYVKCDRDPGTPDPGWFVIANVSTLSKGASYSFKLRPITYPVAGYKYCTVWADKNDDVKESDESNNKKIILFVIGF